MLTELLEIVCNLGSQVSLYLPSYDWSTPQVASDAVKKSARVKEYIKKAQLLKEHHNHWLSQVPPVAFPLLLCFGLGLCVCTLYIALRKRREEQSILEYLAKKANGSRNLRKKLTTGILNSSFSPGVLAPEGICKCATILQTRCARNEKGTRCHL
ncbi:hypothetical protein BC832DRAFT_213996 [Gaertneriomyces semiglobifer]|nr:hypothetical protein BC832DRAFT_213996 [Gaertneriomyces semiglobifer]